MKPIIIGNWKTYINAEEEAVNLIQSIQKPEKTTIVICPSSLHISAVKEIAKEKGIALGAQDISSSEEKPQTGRMTGAQLRDMQVQYVLVGHAETRANGVTNAMVAKKTIHALESELVPVICLSEQNKQQAEGEEVVQQLKEILETSIKQETSETIQKSIIAYEPTEHIGADTASDPKMIQESNEKLRKILKEYNMPKIPIIYGGAVDETNVKDILQEGEASGLLIGRASVDQKAFRKIIKTIETW